MRRRSDRPNLVDEKGEEDGGRARAGVEIGQAIIIASSHLRNSSDRAGGGRMDGWSVGRGRSRRNEDWIRKSNLHARS